MALSSGLTLWAFTNPDLASSTQPQVVTAFQAELSGIAFTTLSPGGFGVLNAKIVVANPRLPRPELAEFSRVALVGEGFRAFLGEIYESVLSGNTESEYITIRALGYGAALRDDPHTDSYSGKTVQYIARDQLTTRSTRNLPIAQDTTQIFADNPATSPAVSYEGRTPEEIIQDVAALAGDYVFAVWDHATQKDAAGFPLGQLSVTSRDTTTTHCRANLQGTAEVIAYNVATSADRAYNYVEIRYNDPAVSGPASATAYDSRLVSAANAFSIGTAPFRFRKFLRDLSGISTVNSTTATTIANTYLAQMKNPPAKVDMTLKACRDAQGNPLPLWQMRAGQNIFVSDLAVRGTQLATAAVAGTNQFYILQTSYTEDASGATLMVSCDNYSDDAAVMVSRLQLIADKAARGANVRTTGHIFALGAPFTGYATCKHTASGPSQNVTLQGTTFPYVLAQAPTSISWFSADRSVNVGFSPSAANLTQYGFRAWVGSSTSGEVEYAGRYKTVGNCLRALDAEAGLFDWHCDGCDTVFEGLRLAGDLLVGPEYMGMHCPRCGASESFSLDLREVDEDETLPGGYDLRAEQARLIRSVMRHPLVSLKTIEER